jgi:hypothetical protein
MTSYASRDDVILFMQRNGVDVTPLTAAHDLRFAVPARSHTRPTAMDYRVPGTPDAGAETRVGRNEGIASAREAIIVDASAADVNASNICAADASAANTSVEDAHAAEATAEDSSAADVDAVNANDGSASAADVNATEISAAHVGAADGGTADGGATSGAADTPVVPLLAQGQSDVFHNTSVWFYDAGSKENADDAAAKLSGKLCGLKLVRTATVDANLVGDLVEPIGQKTNQGPAPVALRRRMAVIAPLPHERDRAILLMGLPAMVPPRSLWAFFGTYDVAAVRLLRRERVASVVFRTPDEARRALRERSNMQMHEQGRLQMKLHA